MYQNKKLLAIIPARGGSKGIPNKNIIQVVGKPLIKYSIDEALKSKYLDAIVVSTEDEAIKKVALECGAEVPFLRPIELAADTSRTIDALIYTLRKLEKEGRKYDYIVLLQPTQPLRKSWHIDEAIEKIVEVDADSLVSVSEVNEHPILMRTIDEKNRANNLLEIKSTVRRQDFSKIYKVNGSVYINKINENFNYDTSLNDNSLAYIMAREFDVDIDEIFDLEIFKLRLENNSPS
ncbi:cytidylyltransferase domain-containing protein [Planomicrobium sp. CPCC 101110]|uniref:acylneuraminate cytidylyltransferase family protein n=1 Tax=Planomicrobium sp. CPCC 101110 TaxID=2599619 RepID=UPI0011B7DE1A|nr:acylneuraminate cytidylyltransferase family protein [Planomicrobium sp. CPCC 101110]TWT27722.1 acylneuraminate cytidylyltransferase family protein [Planomicrobium sp. CPCC 101110]